MLTKDRTKEWSISPLPLSNITSVPLNPHIIEQSDCTFGCEGHLCDAPDGCRPELWCKNSVCVRLAESQPGKVGEKCNSKTPCLSHLRCEKGKCATCSARRTIKPVQKSRTWMGLPQKPQRLVIQPNNPQGTCYTDSLLHLFAIVDMKIQDEEEEEEEPPLCLPPNHHPAPCFLAAHCSANEYCDWGACKTCGDTDACLGAPCRSNAKCKTGYCNDHGRCDYPGQKKRVFGPGANAGRRSSRVPGVPVGHEFGAAKVRNEAMRVVIPEEGAKETGGGKKEA
ncbi:hypothetical protein PtrM4_102550 [Pyrenophora tritici-repentis]|uniref:Uncharacterized protein n=1 Tax=Pyrenophora tritici-repentis TaxID=45151 RepID=A0A834RU64_9PLEO|nr:hypothetical protein PtrM4_102550 [Pyrenophora tritici-repentis]